MALCCREPRRRDEGARLQLAEVLRAALSASAAPHRLPAHHWKTLNAMLRCHTPELGGHLYRCAEFEAGVEITVIKIMRQIAELQREIVAVRSEFETHLRTANADMVAALTKSTEVIAHNSMIIEQIQRKLMG